MIVVSDSSALITLASAGELHLLRDLFGEVLVPDGVWAEVVQAGRPGTEDVTRAGWLRTVPVPDDSFLFALRMDVDPGEAEAIALAYEVKADLLLLDERGARNLAISMGFKVIGVLGVLLRAKQEGLLSELRGVLERMRLPVFASVAGCSKIRCATRESSESDQKWGRSVEQDNESNQSAGAGASRAGPFAGEEPSAREN